MRSSACDLREQVIDDGSEDGETVLYSTGRTRKIDDDRRTCETCHTTAQRRVRCLLEALGPDRFCDAGQLTGQDCPGSFRGGIRGGSPGAAGTDDE